MFAQWLPHVAFAGVYEPPGEVYALLHEKAICAILGTMGNLDSKAKRNGTQVYIELLRNGADILATNDDGHTALTIASAKPELEEIKQYLASQTKELGCLFEIRFDGGVCTLFYQIFHHLQ